MKASNIQHHSDAYGVFAGRPFGDGGVMKNYYRTLGYANLTMQKQVLETYDNSVLAIALDDFSI